MNRTLAWITGSGTFDVPVDWIDHSAGAAPAQTAPDATDTVTFAGPSGGAVQVITGPGAAASAGFTGNTALVGSFDIGVLTVGSAAVPGALAIDPASVVSVASASLVAGSLLVNGPGAALAVSGSLGVAGSVTLLDQASVQVGTLVLNGGAISVDAGSSVEVGGIGGTAAGVLTVDAGATLTSLGGLIEEALVDNGVLLAAAGVTGVFGTVTGNGLLRIGTDATLFLAGTLAAGETIAFADATGALLLDVSSTTLGGVITGFVHGDVIDVAGLTLTGATYTSTGAGMGKLALLANGTTALSVNLAGTYAGDVFTTAPDGIGGTLMTIAAGTLSPLGTLSSGSNGAPRHKDIWIATGGGNWGNASNWNDTTAAANPALMAPGAKDIATVGGTTGSQIITGPGAAFTLTIVGNTVLSGSFSVVTLLVGSATVPASLFVESSSSVVGQAATVFGSLEVSGTAAKLSGGTTFTIGSGTAVSVLNHGSLQGNGLILNHATVTFDSTATLEVGTNGRAAVGLLSVDAAKTLTMNGAVIAGPVLDNGVVLVNGGADVVAGAITGAGVWQIGAGTTLLTGSSVAASETILFAGAAGELLLVGGVAGGVGTISGFAAGDAIDVAGAVFSSAVYAATGSGIGTLVLSGAGSAAMSIKLAGTYTSGMFRLAADGAGGTLVMLATGGGGSGGTLSAGTAGDQYRWLGQVGGDWGTAGNWADVTAGANPALVAPGSNDSVAIAGPTGATVQIITGEGNAASLALTGNTALDGQFATGFLSVGSAIASGTLDIDAGDTLTSLSATLTAGGVQVSGAGALLSFDGLVVGSGVISVQNHAALLAGGLMLNGGSLLVDGTATLEIGALGGAAAGELTVDAGATLTSGGGLIAGALVVDGLLEATAGVTSVYGNISGAGYVCIDPGATLYVGGAIGSGETITFAGSAGELLLASAGAGMAGLITGFVPGDVIDISGSAMTGANYAPTGSNIGVLTLIAKGVVALTLDLAGNYDDTGFRCAADGAGGTLILLTAGDGGPLSEGTPGTDQYVWLSQIGGDWGTAVNWADVTTGSSPALVAPGSNDVVAIAGPAGSGMQVVTGQGQSANLTMTGNTTLTGQFTTGTLAVGGAGAAATLDVAGGRLAAASASLAAGVAMAVLNGAAFQAGGLALDGMLTLGGMSSIEIGVAGGAAAGVLTVDADATLSSDGGVIRANIQNDGLLEASVGVTSVQGNISGGGVMRIDDGATLAIGGAVGVDVTLGFGGTTGTLLLPSPAHPFDGVIAGLLPGDTIDIADTVLSEAAYASTGADTGVLTLLANDQAVASINLGGHYTATSFSIAPDGEGGTDISVPCYVAGTRILTPRGEVPVEELRVGDEVVTLPRRGARLKRVIWIGRRNVDFGGHAERYRVRPVRVRRDAFGPGRPHRDLLLSPEHCLFVDGALIPVHLLLNGATIAREGDVDAVTYLHVELQSHDVIFAEGLPAESYLDTGNRDDFANGTMTRRPTARSLRIWQQRGCAKLVLGGAKLAAARRRLALHAASLGWRLTDDPALHVRVGDREIPPVIERSQYRFVLPQGVRELRLVSRATGPAEMDRDNPDHRPLGVAVRLIALDGRGLRLTDPALREGWHAIETEASAARWRWTDGNAVLACNGARRLDVAIVPVLGYWTDDVVGSGDRAVWMPKPCDPRRGAALAHAAQIVLEEFRPRC